MASPLDIAAQQHGFPNYAAYQANQVQQRQLWQQRHASYYSQPGTGPAVAPQQDQPNFLQNLLGKIPIHPIALFNYVNQKMHDATGN